MFDSNDQNQTANAATPVASAPAMPATDASMPADPASTTDPVSMPAPAVEPTAAPVDMPAFNMTPMPTDPASTTDPVSMPAPAVEPAPADIAAPQPSEPTAMPQPSEPTPITAAPAEPAASGDLLSIKQQALQNLSPLLSQLDQTPEEKFRTTMMLIQASDDQSLIQAAYDAANAITDEKVKAQALLDVVNEINYFTQAKVAGTPATPGQ